MKTKKLTTDKRSINKTAVIPGNSEISFIFLLRMIVFLSGAVLMSLEMAGSRLLAPTFGSSIYTWGSLIIVVMAALTIGYFYGGRIADRTPDLIILGFILAFGGIFIGLLPLWAQWINNALRTFEPRLGSLLASMSFFFIPSVLLATISPYGIKLTSRSLTTIGNTAGHMAAISSAGSIVGTMLTSFFLIPLIGVRNIIHTLGIILLLLSATAFVVAQTKRRSDSSRKKSASLKQGKRKTGKFLIGVIMLIGIISLSIGQTNPKSRIDTLYERDTLYNHIKVTQNGSLRGLHFDNSYQSAIDMDRPLNMFFFYTSYLHLGVVAHPAPARVLFIGLGGGSAVMKFLHDYPSLKTVDAVEIDPEVVTVARKFFMLPDDPRLRIHIQDGRRFVDNINREIAAGRKEAYDMIIIDAYNNASTIPYHLTTREFIDAVRKALSPDGVVVSNLIGAVNGQASQLLRAMSRTTASVFPQIYLFPMMNWHGVNDQSVDNFILIATADPVYRDKNFWRKKASALYRTGSIRENVPMYTKMLIDESTLRNGTWLDDALLLTDDYAPVDTLKNPL